MDVTANTLFSITYCLSLFRRARWDMDGIEDADIPLDSCLFRTRLAQAKIDIDSTGKPVLAQTEAAKRTVAASVPEEVLVAVIRGAQVHAGAPSTELTRLTGELPTEVKAVIEGWFPGRPRIDPTEVPEGQRECSGGNGEFSGDDCSGEGDGRRDESGEGWGGSDGGGVSDEGQPPAPCLVSRQDLLEAVKCDLIRNLGRQPKPLSGTNFIAATLTMFELFRLMEDELEKRRTRCT
jgi:hypothetical protein